MALVVLIWEREQQSSSCVIIFIIWFQERFERLLRSTTVSYTHLDVYKRQGQVRVEGTGRSAFASIYEKYFKLTYKTALRYSGNHHAAEELTQSVFLKLYVHMEHAKVDAVKPWLSLIHI